MRRETVFYIALSALCHQLRADGLLIEPKLRAQCDALDDPANKVNTFYTRGVCYVGETNVSGVHLDNMHCNHFDTSVLLHTGHFVFPTNDDMLAYFMSLLIYVPSPPYTYWTPVAVRKSFPGVSPDIQVHRANWEFYSLGKWPQPFIPWSYYHGNSTVAFPQTLHRNISAMAFAPSLIDDIHNLHIPPIQPSTIEGPFLGMHDKELMTYRYMLCEYSDPVFSMSSSPGRLNSTFVAIAHTAVPTFHACVYKCREASPCRSFAHSAATQECEVYFVDPSYIMWDAWQYTEDDWMLTFKT